MVVDVHGHVGHWSFPTSDLGRDDLIAQMDRWGIDITVVSSSMAVRYDFIEGNRWLDGELSPTDRLLGYVTVNLHYPKESVGQINYYGNKRTGDGRASFVGVKIHPMIQNKRFDSRAGLQIAEAALEYDLPILIHTYGSERETPKQVLPVLQEFPELKVILAHAGGFDWHLAMDIAGSGPNVYAEICSSCTSSDKLVQLIDAFGARRVLFGTDTTLFHPGYALGMVHDAKLDQKVLQLLMGRNAIELFDLDTHGK